MLKLLSNDHIGAGSGILKTEPMFFRAGVDFIDNHMELCDDEFGSITQDAISMLPMEVRDDPSLSIDTRVHMLKPGWYPAIPGWHCDAIPRGDDGQPGFDHPAIKDIRHFLMVIDASDRPTDSLTEFSRHFDLHMATLFHKGWTLDGRKEPYWGWVSNVIDIAHSRCNHSDIVKIESGKLYEFDCGDLHRAMPAKTGGWRWFFRATVGAANPIANEVRQQAQVYLPGDGMGGW